MSLTSFQQLSSVMKTKGSYRGRPSVSEPEDYYWYITVAFANGYGVMLRYFFNQEKFTAVFYENKNNKEGHTLLAKPRFNGRNIEQMMQQIEKVALFPDSRYKDYTIAREHHDVDDQRTYTWNERPVAAQCSLQELREALAQNKIESNDE